VDDTGRPKSELAYFRCDNDGYRWWNTVWHIHPELETPGLVKEFDGVYEAFTEAFPTLQEMTRFCMSKLDPLSDSTEYDAFLELEHGNYWLRMITRKGDYNLYLHCYAKDAEGLE
jgi:hypothetical protein